MNAPGRNALSPVSTDSADWSPITRYQSLQGSSDPYSPSIPPNDRGITPPASVHSSTATADGMSAPMIRAPPPGGNPSPPSSIARSSDGTGLYASRLAEAEPPPGSRKMSMLEDVLGEHYRVLKSYLGPYLRDEKGNPRPSRAKDKLTRLSPVQFQELSTDVYDESLRREEDRKRGGPNAPGNETPKYLLPKNNFHPKRNQARQKLSTLPLERFRQLATDVYYELERRVPRFAAGDMARSSSPAASIASRASSNRGGPPSRVGTPNSMGPGMRPNGRPPGPPPPGYRGPPGPPGFMPPGQQNELGRPLPKTFQQNTIVPNKGTMVEDDDDDSAGMDDEDAFNLEGAAARQSRRATGKSLNLAQEKLVTELQSELAELKGKYGALEENLREKDEEIQKLKDAEQQRETTTASERAEWDELRLSLEEKVEKAESLNLSLQSELDKIRTEKEETEDDLRKQITELESTPKEISQSRTSEADDGEWRQRVEELEQELDEQQRLTDEVRRDASRFLHEMRELSIRSEAAMEKEERMSSQISALESEVQEWKSRYARAKTQLRTLKTSSIGLASPVPTETTTLARDSSLSCPDGLVKDVHVTEFQLSIDELLQIARKSDSDLVLESMRHVVKCVRAITGDIDCTPLSQMQSPISSINGDSIASPEKQQARLKARVSATANNLITASKNHASSNGLSPVSLLDAAASHLSTAVVELVKFVKVKPTPSNELESREEDDVPMPLKTNGYADYDPYNSEIMNGYAPPSNAGHQRHRSHGGSNSSAGYSAYSYGGYDDRQSADYGHSTDYTSDARMADYKNYLDDQTALLVQNIQPLVHLIRSTTSAAQTSPFTDADEQQVLSYIREIAQAVRDTVTRTFDAVGVIPNPALREQLVPVADALERCRQDLLAINVREGRWEGIPPLAFKTAKAMKELVLRVERIESGNLTAGQPLSPLPVDF